MTIKSKDAKKLSTSPKKWGNIYFYHISNHKKQVNSKPPKFSFFL